MRAYINGLFAKVGYGQVSELSTSLRGNEVVWRSKDGNEEIRKDPDGVQYHYRGGEIEAVGYGPHARFLISKHDPLFQTMFDAWFAEGVQPQDRKPILRERLESPLGPDPDTGLAGAVEIWDHPEFGEVSVPITVDHWNGTEQRFAPHWLRGSEQTDEPRASLGL